MGRGGPRLRSIGSRGMENRALRGASPELPVDQSEQARAVQEVVVDLQRGMRRIAGSPAMESLSGNAASGLAMMPTKMFVDKLRESVLCGRLCEGDLARKRLKEASKRAAFGSTFVLN